MGRTRYSSGVAASNAQLVGFDVHKALPRVAERLERSRAMLALGDDWDGEGSPGYTETTWVRAAELVVEAATVHHQLHGEEPPAPMISKSDAGSIDVQWRTPHRNVLINVPASTDEPVTFYAHDQENPKRDFGGELTPGPRNQALLVWLLA